MDIIIIATGLTILLARDVYRTVRRRRREKKIKKRLLEAGIDPGIYTQAEYRYLTSSRQYYNYRDHMQRFHRPPPGVPIPPPRTSPGHPDRGFSVLGGVAGSRRTGDYGRSMTVDGSGFHDDHGVGSEYPDRMGTPPPAYTPPPRMSSEFMVSGEGDYLVVGADDGLVDSPLMIQTPTGVSVEGISTGELTHIPPPTGPPPPFEHAYTTDASGVAAEARRKVEGLGTVVEYVDHQRHSHIELGQHAHPPQSEV